MSLNKSQKGWNLILTFKLKVIKKANITKNAYFKDWMMEFTWKVTLDKAKGETFLS